MKPLASDEIEITLSVDYEKKLPGQVRKMFEYYRTADYFADSGDHVYRMGGDRWQEIETAMKLPDMKLELPPSTTVTTWDYIRELYEPEDPVAVVLIRKEPSLTIQRVESARKVAGQAYQRYLRAQNAQGFNVYISMNPVFAAYAVRLTIPVGDLENTKNLLREASFLSPEKAAFEQEAAEASLTWKFRADRIAEAKGMAESVAREIEGRLPKGEAGTYKLAVMPQSNRLKKDIREVKRLYIDFDEEGTRKVKAMLKGVKEGRPPLPNYVLNTSPDKYQVVWNVNGLEASEAESLIKTLARVYGGDPACSDVSRVFRLPGLHNKKYAETFRVGGERLTSTQYNANDFAFLKDLQTEQTAPQDARTADAPAPAAADGSTESTKPGGSQSERDWAYCCRELEKTVYRSSPHKVDANLNAAYPRLEQWLIQNCSPNHQEGRSSSPQEYARRTIANLRAHMNLRTAGILEQRRKNSFFDEAEAETKKVMGEYATCYAANRTSGIYNGTVIGETAHYYLQRLSAKTIIAHRKESIGELKTGQNYTISYKNNSADFIPMKAQRRDQGKGTER